MSKAYAAQPEMLLQKIIGGFKNEERKEEQYFECKVMSDIPEVADVRKWIADLPSKTITGMHFRATSPSVQLLAYGRGSEPVVIVKDHSQIEQAQAESTAEETAVEELKKIFNKYCPSPSPSQTK